MVVNGRTTEDAAATAWASADVGPAPGSAEIAPAARVPCDATTGSVRTAAAAPCGSMRTSAYTGPLSTLPRLLTTR